MCLMTCKSEVLCCSSIVKREWLILSDEENIGHGDAWISTITNL